MHEHDAALIPGVLAGLGSGLAVGAVNVGLILLLRIPPIIATLSASFLVQSAAIVDEILQRALPLGDAVARIVDAGKTGV